MRDSAPLYCFLHPLAAILIMSKAHNSLCEVLGDRGKKNEWR